MVMRARAAARPVAVPLAIAAVACLLLSALSADFRHRPVLAETPDEAHMTAEEKMAAMFKQWNVVKDVRALPNPDYMTSEGLPLALRGSAVDDVAQRAARSAIADMDAQRRQEEDTWAPSDGGRVGDDVLGTILPVDGVDVVPEFDEEWEEEHEGEEDEEGYREDVAEREKAEARAQAEDRQRSANLKKIRWLGAARSAAGFVASAQTMTDRAALEDWEQAHPWRFPEALVFPDSKYPTGAVGLDEGEQGWDLESWRPTSAEEEEEED